MVTINLIGRLTADPTITEVNGRSCCNFSVAARTRRKDSTGNIISDFYKVGVWGAQGDSCARFLSKGSMVAVTGSADQSPYVAQNGEARSGMQITASHVEFISTRNDAKPEASDKDDEDMFS